MHAKYVHARFDDLDIDLDFENLCKPRLSGFLFLYFDVDFQHMHINICYEHSFDSVYKFIHFKLQALLY